MEQDIDSIVNDVNLYSEGLILALRNEKFNEAEEYTKKMKKHLDAIRAYIKMKKKLKSKN